MDSDREFENAPNQKLKDARVDIRTSRDHSGLVRNHVAPLAAYLAVTVVYAYPASLNFGALIPGRGDAYWFLWQLWWFQHSLIDRLQSPLTTDRIFFPLDNVPVMWQTPVNELFTVPLQVAVGIPTAFTLLVLASFVLSGYTMHLLLVHLVQRRDVAFVGGLIFAFNAYRGIRAQAGHLSLLTTQWMPLLLLLGLWLWRRPSLRKGIGVGAVAGLVALSTPYYVAYFLLPVGLSVALYVAVWRRRRLFESDLWRALVMAIGVAAVMVVPFYVSYLQTSPQVRAAAQEAGATSFVYIADLFSWFLPPKHNPLWSKLFAPLYEPFAEHYLQASTLFFGFLPPLFALASIWPWRALPRQIRFWQILAGVTALLAFGPVLKIGGATVLDWMPYRLFMALPGAYAFRAPARIGVTTIFAAVVLTSILLARLAERHPRWPWRAIFLGWGCLLVTSMSPGFPFPSAPLDVPASYEIVRRMPDDFAILELPAGELFLSEVSQYMYFQTAHQKRLVSGYLARRPVYLLEPTRTTPFVRRFFVEDWGVYFSGDWENLIDWPSEPLVLAGQWPEDVRNGPAILADWGVRYVLVHRTDSVTSFSDAANILLTHSLGAPQHVDEDVWLYEVPASRMVQQGALLGFGEALVDFEDAAFSPPFLHRRVVTRHAVTGAKDGEITLQIPLSGTWRLHWLMEGALANQVQVALDGTPVKPLAVPLAEGLAAYQIERLVDEGVHTLTFAWPDKVSPANSTCRSLCVLDLTVSALQFTRPAPGGPVAQFVNDRGQQIDLLHVATRQLVEAGEVHTFLLTEWRYASRPAGVEPTSKPVFYVHLTDETGATLAQADHTLGEQSFWFPEVDSATFLDVVELPQDAATRPDVQIRGGLWYPAEQRYFWTTDPERSDEANRFMFGSLHSFLPSLSPSLPLTREP